MAYDFFHQRVRVNTVVPGGGGIVSGMSLGRVGGDAARFGKGAPGTAAGRVAATPARSHNSGSRSRSPRVAGAA